MNEREFNDRLLKIAQEVEPRPQAEDLKMLIARLIAGGGLGTLLGTAQGAFSDKMTAGQGALTGLTSGLGAGAGIHAYHKLGGPEAMRSGLEKIKGLFAQKEAGAALTDYEQGLLDKVSERGLDRESSAYEDEFFAKCAEYGLEKEAVLKWLQKALAGADDVATKAPGKLQSLLAGAADKGDEATGAIQKALQPKSAPTNRLQKEIAKRMPKEGPSPLQKALGAVDDTAPKAKAPEKGVKITSPQAGAASQVKKVAPKKTIGRKASPEDVAKAKAGVQSQQANQNAIGASNKDLSKVKGDLAFALGDLSDARMSNELLEEGLASMKNKRKRDAILAGLGGLGLGGGGTALATSDN